MRIDLHTHAKLSKATEFSEAYYRQMLEEAAAAGLTALALTEHFNTRNFKDVYAGLDRMFPYNGHVYEANGLSLFPGMEVDIREKGHILLIGSRDEVLELRERLDLYTEKGRFISFDLLMDFADDYPLLKIGAHPFRESNPLLGLSREQLSRLDAFDLNAKDVYRYGLEVNREQVEQLARELGKPVTGGSDTHQCLQFGSVWNELEREARTAAELKGALLRGEHNVFVSDDLELRVKAAVMLKKLMKKLAVLEGELVPAAAGEDDEMPVNGLNTRRAGTTLEV
ncbi:histidinol-phosphatase [Paenibacillus pasadenensis]|uniref:PHP-associated domain-containing protein n=1 Tax=Paenibacillus pasadenensis TaxID=217090 RepID=UPI00203AF418|nr:PHP-associated domain-containing protein [Paenibacillus pasadenensis]MCM3747614.1 histidinol-phosphatase [Paenibacillus pasadenensis]